jgi:hypothetical protein
MRRNMNPKHITSQSLRRLLALTEKKEQFLKGLEEIENEIAKAVTGAATSVVEVAEAITPFKPAKTKAKKTRKAKAAKPGGLKERILALLQDAGDQGLRVKEIAEKLGAKTANISVWFSTTGKKLADKVEPGRYVVKGAKAASAPDKVVTGYVKPPASLKPKTKRTAKKVSAKSTAAAAKAPKPAKPAEAKKSGLTPEGRAKLAANMKARWAARKAAKPAAKPAKPAKKASKFKKTSNYPF